MSVRDELLQLMRDNDGLLTVEAVHDWAVSHPQSDLYSELEWNDAKAGLEYRYWQIRRLIAINVKYEEQPEIRQFVSLSSDRVNRNGGGYRDLGDVLRSQTLHQTLLADALADLQRLERKYEMLQALKPLWRMVARIRQKQQQRGKKGGVEKRMGV